MSDDSGSGPGHPIGHGDLSGLNWIRATDDPDPDAECIEIAAGEGDLVHLRQSDDRDNVVTTTQAKWDAFVLGVQNNEFDHFVEDVEDVEDVGLPGQPVSGA